MGETAETHHFADLRGLRLHYVTAGEGPLVVLLHGFPDFWYSWRHQIPYLASAGFKVVAPDMRGYNLSDSPAGVDAYGLDLLVEDVKLLVEHLGADRAHVVGHDWGAIVAWYFAMGHGDALERLAILNVPHPARFVEMARSPRQALRSWYVAFFQAPLAPEALLSAMDFWTLRQVLRNEPTRPDAFDDTDIEAYVEAARNSGGMRGPINYYRALARRNPLEALRESRVIEHETLVLWGERDGALESRFADPPAKLVPNRHVVRFEQAGHWVHLEEPDRVNDALARFLQDGAV